MKRHNGIEWDNKGRWVDHTEANARIAELEAEVERKDVVIAGLKLAGLTNSALLSQLTEANGLLHEIDIWAQCHPAGAFGLRDILAKRKGVE